MNDEKRDIGKELIQGLQELIEGKETRRTEVNLIKCKVCEQLKTRIEAGKYPNGKIKVYTNEFGKKWNGKTCPDCNKDRVKNVMRAGRLGKTSENL